MCTREELLIIEDLFDANKIRMYAKREIKGRQSERKVKEASRGIREKVGRHRRKKRVKESYETRARRITLFIFYTTCRCK